MNKQILQKAVLIVVSAAVLVLVNLVGFRICVSNTVSLISVPAAAADISPRTQITAQDITYIEIPSAYIEDNVFLTADEIIGKYTEIQGMIPAGSLFYKSMLYEESELPDLPVLQLESGQALYTLETSLADASALTAQQRIDIYVSIERRDSTPLTGCLLENVRIVSVQDHNGVETSDPESTGIPYLLSLAIDKDDIDLLTMAETSGELRIFASSGSYDFDSEAVRREDTAVTIYLLSLLETEQ